MLTEQKTGSGFNSIFGTIRLSQRVVVCIFVLLCSVLSLLFCLFSSQICGYLYFQPEIIYMCG